MEVDKALDQISQIHAQLSRHEVYRGYQSIPVAATGLTAIGGAVLLQFLAARNVEWVTEHRALIFFWIAIAIVNSLITVCTIVWQYRYHSTRERSQTRMMARQFAPCIAAGALISGVLLQQDAALAWLPGIWAVLFSLGLFASRPNLPRMIGWVALYYLAGGGILLAIAPNETSLHPWAMGCLFGIGQLITAFVLYWNLERKNGNT